MDHSKKSTYLFSIDALRVIAIIAVVIIHATTKTLATLGLNPDIAPLSFFLNQTARFAVPLFFLISGFVLELNYKEKLSYIEFFKKRASRIILPFIFWSAIYIVYLDNFKLTKLLNTSFIKSLVYGTASYQLYFIPTLIIFYLAFPLLHKLLPLFKNIYFFVILVFFQTYLLFYDYYFKTIKTNYIVRIALLSIVVFIVGMIASHYKDKLLFYAKKHFKILAGLLFILFPTVYFHSRFFMVSTHQSNYMYSQYHPLNYFYTIVVSLVLFYSIEKWQIFRKTFIQLSKLSFFVFFIHVLIQYLVWDNIVVWIIMSFGKNVIANFWFDPLLITIIGIISFGLAFLIHKIPNAYKITG